MLKVICNSTPIISLHSINRLDILIKAKQMKIIDKVKPILNELIYNKIYISDRVYNIIIELAGE